MPKRVVIALRQAGCLVIAATVCGLVFNYFHRNRLPLIALPPVIAEADPRTIDVPHARWIFEEGTALFIDARAPADYKRGHIPGAVNLYAETYNPEGADILNDIPYETLLVIYCDGDACGLSRHLADELERQGYQNIKILFAGWKGWAQGETGSF